MTGRSKTATRDANADAAEEGSVEAHRPARCVLDRGARGAGTGRGGNARSRRVDGNAAALERTSQEGDDYRHRATDRTDCTPLTNGESAGSTGGEGREMRTLVTGARM